MRVTPRTEEECKRVLLSGRVSFSVKDATDEVSGNNSETIKLVMDCYDNAGQSGIVYCYLSDGFPERLREFCYSVGLDSEYESGNLDAAACLHRDGQCDLEIRKQKGFPDSSVVKKFIVGGHSAGAPAQQQRTGIIPPAQQPPRPQGNPPPRPASLPPRPNAAPPAQTQTPEELARSVSKRAAYEKYYTWVKSTDASIPDEQIQTEFQQLVAAYFGSKEAGKAANAQQIDKFAMDNFQKPVGTTNIQQPGGAPGEKVKEADIPFE